MMRRFKDILRNLSIRHKMMVISLSVTGIAIFLASVIHIMDEVIIFRDSVGHELEARAKLMSHGLAPSLKGGDTERTEQILLLLRSTPHVVQAVVYRADGTVVATYNKERWSNSTLSYRNDRHIYYDASSIHIFYPIEDSGGTVGTLYLKSDLTGIYAHFKSHLAGLLIIVVVSFGVVYIFLAKVQNWITEPIQRLIELMHSVSSRRDYSVRATVESRDEIGTLVAGFNSMIEEIDRRDRELETRVRKRTAELNRTLREMESYKDRFEDACKKLKESEKNLVQAAKLASLGELGAGIAHELNSPLAGILSITEVLLKRVDRGEPNYFFLEKIKDAALRARNIIVDLLSYSRPTRDIMEPLDVNDVVKSTLSLFISELKTTSVEIHEELSTELPSVKGNKGQLMEVLLNLIKNARDALYGSGSIYIRTGLTERGVRKFVFCEVEDTGRGIPDDVKDKIFDPFFTTKEKGGGLNVGLGLCICKSIVDVHGGTIEFETTLGEGTVFRILLPVYRDDTLKKGGEDNAGGDTSGEGTEKEKEDVGSTGKEKDTDCG